jgi:hypothetical protein
MSMPRCQYPETQMRLASKGFRAAVDSTFTEGFDLLRRFLGSEQALLRAGGESLCIGNYGGDYGDYYGTTAESTAAYSKRLQRSSKSGQICSLAVDALLIVHDATPTRPHGIHDFLSHVLYIDIYTSLARALFMHTCRLQPTMAHCKWRWWCVGQKR